MKKLNVKFNANVTFLIFSLYVLNACSSTNTVTTPSNNNLNTPTVVNTPTTVSTSSTTIPDFVIKANTGTGSNILTQQITVFGISVYAVKSVPANKIVHAANILAQYLDNDENGIVDDSAVHKALIDGEAKLFMWSSTEDIDIIVKGLGSNSSFLFGISQDLGADETVPEWHNDKSQQFDASLEEVMHLISSQGISKAYPTVFGETGTTSLTINMDKARGGKFLTIPTSYPSSAWYTYSDSTCDYKCQSTEYFYWVITSILGAQTGRNITDEWKLTTNALVKSRDLDSFNLFTNPIYKLPTKLPDGTYRR